jgi:uncharacterized protein
MDFLYDWHRLNVAVSRAKGLALVVASPDLLRVKPRNVEQLREANALCRLVEVAAGDGATLGPREAAAAPSAPGPGRSGPAPDLTLWPELDR